MNNLQLAAIECNKRWMATLPENPPEPEYSEEFHKNMEKLLDRMRGNRYHYLTRKTARVILVAAIVMSLLTVTVFATTDLGAYILNELSDHAIFQSLFESEENVDGKIECEYIPEGFEVVQEDCGDIQCFIIYQNSNGLRFTISKMENGAEMGLDNENTEKEIISSNGKEFVIYRKDNDEIRIVWCDENFTYRFDGNTSYEESFKITESVK